jgi:tripartite-type tricarboxylate transporter receptor subunit TctC
METTCARRVTAAAVALVSASASLQAFAQVFPNRPVRMVVAVAAGGSTDVIARIVGARLSERIGQPVVVDNRPGASGIIGVELVVRSQPDGHTLLMGAGSLGTINALMPKAPFHAAKDLAPVALLGTSPYVLVVQPSLPVKSVPDLIAHAKANPGKLNFAGSTPGSLQRLAGEHLNRMAGIDLLYVPYKGTGQVIPDLIAGRLHVAFDNVLILAPYIRTGAMRGLAVTGSTRSSVMPDLPTIGEAGVPGFQAAGWFGVFASAGTPSPVIARLNTELSALMNEPAIRDRLVGQGLDPLTGPPGLLRSHLAREMETWGKVIRESGLTIQ